MTKQEIFDKWIEDCGEEEPGWDKSYWVGWNNCKERVLELIIQYSKNWAEMPYAHLDTNEIFEEIKDL